jgi:polysaccharide biosynthesis protein PelA
MRNAGLFVTATDYTRDGDSSTTALAVSNACSAGALPWVSNIGLTRFPPQPYRCL